MKCQLIASWRLLEINPKWLTFTLIDGNWDIQLWADSAKQVYAKVYRPRVKVPAELVGEKQTQG